MKFGALLLVFAGLTWGVSVAVSKPQLPLDAQPEPTREALLADLRADHPVTRAQAVVWLAQQPDTSAVADVRTLLHNDPSASVRGVAAIALGHWKDVQSTHAIAVLLAQDKEISPDVLLDALTRMGDPAGAEAVLPYLNADSDVLRLQAVEALVAMQAQVQGDAILRQALANTDVEKAKNYAVVLGKLKVAAAQDYLIRLARTTPASPTLSASYLALGRIDSRKAIPLLSEAIGRDFVKGRENAVEALLQIHSPQTLPLVFPYLAHANRDVQLAAAEVVALIPDPASGPRLLRLLEQPVPNGPGPVAYALGRLKYRPAQARLTALLADTSSPDRETIARAFGWMGGRDNVALLIRTLREPDGEGRYGAAWSLGILEATEAVEALQQAASGNSVKLANLSIEALGMIHAEQSLPYLARKVETSPELAATLLASIANIPGAPARQTLEDFAGHADLRINRPALQGLAQRKDPDSVPALMRMIDTAVPDNRKQVYFALSAVTGQKFSSASEWRNWYAKTDGLFNRVRPSITPQNSHQPM